MATTSEPAARGGLNPPPCFADDAARAVVVELLSAAQRAPESHASIVRLFNGLHEMPHSEARACFGSALQAFVESGLLTDEAGTVRAAACVESIEGRLFASDLRDAHRTQAAQYVLGLGGVTRRIAGLMPRRAGARMLDLGCGCGVLAVLAAQTAASVTAIDINPRAIAFTRFNAALNNCTNLSARVGDLYAPVTGEQFDLIVSNAPYVISPDSTYLYRDGGKDFCERMARATPACLAEGGCAMLAANWVEREGCSWQADLAGWFAQAGCDTWILRTEQHTPEDYARLWLLQQHGDLIPPAELERWTDSYRTSGIRSLHGGYCVLSKPVAREPWIEMRDLPPGDGLGGGAIDRILRARDLAVRHDDAALIALDLQPLAGLQAIEHRRPGPSGWQVDSVDLRAADGLRITVRVDPKAADMLGWMDGTRDAAGAATLFAQAHDLDADAVLAALPAFLRTLLDAGLLQASADG